MIEISWKKETDNEELSYSTQRPLMTIGRDSVNDISLDDGRVSLYHAAIIENETGDYFIRDLGSLQGVAVNGQPHHRRLLSRGDTIDIIDYRLKIKHISKGSSGSQVFLCGIVTPGEVEIPIIDSNEKYIAKRFPLN